MLEEVITKISGAFADTLPVHNGALTIEHNPHKLKGTSVDKHVLNDDETLWISPLEMQAAIANNELWCLTWFPDRDGYCRIYGSTLQAVMVAMYVSEVMRLKDEEEQLKARLAVPTKVQVMTPSGYTMASSDFTKGQTAQETAQQLMKELGLGPKTTPGGLILP